MKIGFVILCYGHPQMVTECVDYLEKIKGFENTAVVIVDNCSPDNTYDVVKSRISGLKNICLLKNKANEGFARGNNFGYKYAREVMGCECIIVMNSDVLIEDVDFIIKLKGCLKKYDDISIIAPDALGRNNRHSNPLCDGKFSKPEIYRQILMNQVSVYLLRAGINYFCLTKKKETTNATEEQHIKYNIIPHGCCVIYTPFWTKTEPIAFYPRTFLFCEEFFLYDYAMAKGYRTAYLPTLQVRHIGDASIDSNVGNERKKRIFVNSSQAKSLRLLLKFENDVINNWCNENE